MPSDPSTWRPLLSRGMVGEDVRAWQGMLVQAGLLAKADMLGVFGPKTEKATVTFQIAHGLKADGAVGEQTRAALGTPLPAVPAAPEIFDSRWRFLQAAGYTKVSSLRTVTLVTMHTMQDKQRPDTAEGVASWFSGARGTPPDASAHVCGDMDSIVQCVKPNDVAWGAPGGNALSYHCEQAGFAEWSRDVWLEADNLAMIHLMASHVRLALAHFGLPQAALVDDEVAACVRDSLIVKGQVKGVMSGVVGGICEHRQLTRVWQQWDKFGLPNPKAQPKPFWPTHTDCGNGYPMDVLLSFVKGVP